MSETLVLGIIIGYFVLLFVISQITGRKANEETFFTADRNSPWYVVAFGMIGASLSGVTFISVPGAVGNGAWGYMQIVFGYLLGYAVIALVLLPLYYRLNLTSIYGYLRQRFGEASYRTGAAFFLLSRIIGASLRMYLVVLVLDLAIGRALGIPFWGMVLISIALIFIYTFRGGIKTVVWTDTLQTFCMLLGAGITVCLIGQELDLSAGGMMSMIAESDYSKVFFWDWGPGNNFFKQFFSGAFIAIVMTGLDQDMMQKNLTCRSLGDAQKNVYTFSVVLIFANLLFLSLGALLYLYGTQTGIVELVFMEDCAIRIADPDTGEMICHKTDELFPLLSLNYLGPVAGIVFILGVIAAAYSSADSALTALTTSFCVDILDFEEKTDADWKKQTRYLVHIGFSILLFIVILIFKWMNDDAVIWAVFDAAGYTYGPLLGLYAFGLFTQIKVKDQWVPVVCVLSPILVYLIQMYSPVWFGYSFGFEKLILNGLLTMGGLWLLRETR
ncbi:MAG: sodium:solute symporter [Bacteroidota bacterium]